VVINLAAQISSPNTELFYRNNEPTDDKNTGFLIDFAKKIPFFPITGHGKCPGSQFMLTERQREANIILNVWRGEKDPKTGKELWKDSGKLLERIELEEEQGIIGITTVM